MKPTVSIIIPIYKTEQYIVTCIRSVINQTFRDFELILVDDCSPDYSMDIACNLLNEAPNIPVIKLRTPRNSGVSVSRNLGLDNANGDYILFVDSDDYISNDCLESLLNMSIKYPKADFILGNHSYVGKYSKQDGLGYQESCLPEYTEGETESKSIILRHYYLTHIFCNRLLKRDWLIKHNLHFQPGIVYEDTHLIFFLAKYTRAFAICEKVTYYYNIREGSITTAISSRNFKSMDWIIADHMRHIDKKRLISQLTFILHNAHLSYVSRLKKDEALPGLFTRYFKTIVRLYHAIKTYKGTTPDFI